MEADEEAKEEQKVVNDGTAAAQQMDQERSPPVKFPCFLVSKSCLI